MCMYVYMYVCMFVCFNRGEAAPPGVVGEEDGEDDGVPELVENFESSNESKLCMYVCVYLCMYVFMDGCREGAYICKIIIMLERFSRVSFGCMQYFKGKRRTCKSSGSIFSRKLND